LNPGEYKLTARRDVFDASLLIAEVMYGKSVRRHLVPSFRGGKVAQELACLGVC
jgi:hypothetical protein